MSEAGRFLVYCIETYKTAKNLSGRQVMELFTEYKISEYIFACFESLHTTGDRYIVNDIDMFIEARKA
ncbi:MAG: DUF3791 domain-containing protein [Ruminococcaceae bacterium]|nr:DUF3791 domain-containing protein [Oscillospiraceae bacterium]MBR3596723.1 DUF3791 domain-containing protein [Clostridia bacterium]